MKKVSFTLKSLVIALSLSAPFVASATEPTSTTTSGGSSSSFWWWWGKDDNAPSVPLDGGLSLLLAAGVGYGARKVAVARKKAKGDDSIAK